jgi:hypothetical protein
MIRKLLGIVASVVLFLVAMAFFFFLLFPFDSLTEVIEAKVAQTGFLTVDIGEVERDSVGSVSFTDIKIDLSMAKLEKSFFPGGDKGPGAAKLAGAKGDVGGDEGDEGEASEEGGTAGEAAGTPGTEPASDSDEGQAPKAGSLFIDRFTVQFGLLDLLTPNAFKIGLDLELLGGEITDTELRFRASRGYQFPKLTVGAVRDLDLAGAPLLGELFSGLMPSMKAGSLSGILETASIEADPVFDEVAEGEETPEEGPLVHYSGEIKMRIRDLVAVAPRLVMKYRHAGQEVQSEEFRLSDMKLGECNFDIQLGSPEDFKSLGAKQRKRDGTVIMFERGDCSGDSIDYAVRKGSYIRIPAVGGWASAKLDIWTKLAFSSAYFEEKLEEGGVVVSQNDALDKAMRFQQGGFAKSRDVDGYYWMHCTGSMSAARCKSGLPPEEKRRKDGEEDRKRREQESARKVVAEPGATNTVVTSRPTPPNLPEGATFKLGNPLKGKPGKPRGGLVSPSAPMPAPEQAPMAEPTAPEAEATVVDEQAEQQVAVDPAAAEEEAPAEYGTVGEEAAPAEGLEGEVPQEGTEEGQEVPAMEEGAVAEEGQVPAEGVEGEAPAEEYANPQGEVPQE